MGNTLISRFASMVDLLSSVSGVDFFFIEGRNSGGTETKTLSIRPDFVIIDVHATECISAQGLLLVYTTTYTPIELVTTDGTTKEVALFGFNGTTVTFNGINQSYCHGVAVKL